MKFLVLGSDTPWVRGLCTALIDLGVEVEALNVVDICNAFCSQRGGRAFSERTLYLPPSYGTRLAALCGGYITKHVTDMFCATNDTWLVATNPVFERWTRTVPDAKLIYWMFDDYELYQPSRTAEIKKWETALLRRASITLCSSRFLLDRVQSRAGQRGVNVCHFPNAVEGEWLKHRDDVAVRHNTVGYIGNMGERVDWVLVHDVIRTCPGRDFIFVGDTGGDAGTMSEWRRRALALPNAKCLGMVPHNELWRHYHAFEVNWMPYDIDNPFNQACCPTKIFDALATGRPFLSTAVPECLLYPDHVRIFERTADVESLLMVTVGMWTDQLATRQVRFVAQNDWRTRANALLGYLGEAVK